MTIQTIVLLVLIVVLVILEIAYSTKKRNLSGKLTTLLMEHRFDELDALLSKKSIKRYIKAYNFYYLKLNKAIIQRNNEEALECINALNSMKCSNEQKHALYNKEFYFFLSIDDKEKAEEAYNSYKNISGDELEDIDIMYDTFVLGKSTYLERTLEAYKEAPKEKLPDLDLLLSEMYKNSNNTAEANKYSKYAQKHVEELRKARN